MTKEQAQQLSNKVNDKISDIYKELTKLENLLESDQYKALIESNNKELQEVVELGALPLDFLGFLEMLPEMF
jgi:6-phosphogluconate dehydrogenase